MLHYRYSNFTFATGERRAFSESLSGSRNSGHGRLSNTCFDCLTEVGQSQEWILK